MLTREAFNRRASSPCEDPYACHFSMIKQILSMAPHPLDIFICGYVRSLLLMFLGRTWGALEVSMDDGAQEAEGSPDGFSEAGDRSQGHLIHHQWLYALRTVFFLCLVACPIPAPGFVCVWASAWRGWGGYVSSLHQTPIWRNVRSGPRAAAFEFSKD